MKTNFRTILRDELGRRSARNPRYSLRSFARDLGLSPSTLSDVLNSRYGISPSMAKRVSEKLNLNDNERGFFCDLVESEHGRKAVVRQQAKQRIKEQNSADTQLTLDAFQLISDWYHYGILEALSLADAEHSTSWLSARLGIPEVTIEAAIERLSRLGLLQIKAGKFVIKDSFTATPSGIPSDAIRKFHRQILEKAIDALDTQRVEERSVTNMMLAVDEADIKEADVLIKKFRREFETRFGKTKGGNEVYTLNIQYFRLTKPTHKTRGN